MDGRQGRRAYESALFLRNRTGRDAAATLDAVFKTVATPPWGGVLSIVNGFGWLQISPFRRYIPKDAAGIYSQVSNPFESAQRLQRYRFAFQVRDLCCTGQSLGPVDQAGTGPA